MDTQLFVSLQINFQQRVEQQDSKSIDGDNQEDSLLVALRNYWDRARVVRMSCCNFGAAPVESYVDVLPETEESQANPSESKSILKRMYNNPTQPK